MGTAAALALVVGAAVVTALIALPLALRKIPRNRLYGVRTRRTLGDDRVWYERRTPTAAAILYGLTPLPRDLLVPAGLAAFVVPSLVAAILAVRHAS